MNWVRAWWSRPGLWSRALTWWRSPGVLASRAAFAAAVAASVAMREALDAEERVGMLPESVPPEARDSGPDVLDGLSMGAHP